MRHFYPSLLLAAGILLAGATACSDDDSPFAEGGNEEEVTPPQEGILVLSGTPAHKLGQLLQRVDPALCMTWGKHYMAITDEQKAEIADFTASLMADKGTTTERQKFDCIFEWVTANIKYENQNGSEGGGSLLEDYNAPYNVFKNRKAICQGFANLTRLMCILQGIPSVAANGSLADFGGHAWLYCLVEGKWIVSDPTNNANYEMDDWKSHEDWLMPTMADIDFASEDGFVCNFYEEAYNLRAVMTESTSVTIPENVGGVRLTGFNPDTLAVPIEEIHIGANITSLGYSRLGLKHAGSRIRAVTVDENNPALETYKGVVYRKYVEKSYIPYYTPARIEEVTLRPMQVMEKNIVTDLHALKRLYVADGTVTIEDWAVENCPVLEEIHLPASVTNIAKDAFTQGVPADVKIIHEKEE